MYRPAAFAEDDHARLAALARAWPLASLVGQKDGRIIAAHAPLVIETDSLGTIVALNGHLARSNPFWSELGDGAEVLVIFSGPSAYVSPTMYPSKSEHGRVVPTWNYVRIEARGRIAFEIRPEQVHPYVDAVTSVHETDRAEPWTSADAPADYVAALSRGLVGFHIDVGAIEGVLKLAQSRPAADFEGVMAALRASDAPSDQAVASMMRGLAG